MRARLIFVFVVLATLLLPVGAASAATPNITSDGCRAANEANFDGLAMSGGFSGMEFAKGETLTIVADEPHDYGSPIVVNLTVNFQSVDASEFPGTVSHTFPEGGAYTAIGWIVDGGNATWDVSCEAPAAEASFGGAGSSPVRSHSRNGLR